MRVFTPPGCLARLYTTAVVTGIFTCTTFRVYSFHAWGRSRKLNAEHRFRNHKFRCLLPLRCFPIVSSISSSRRRLLSGHIFGSWITYQKEYGVQNVQEKEEDENAKRSFCQSCFSKNKWNQSWVSIDKKTDFHGFPIDEIIFIDAPSVLIDCIWWYNESIQIGRLSNPIDGRW